MKAPELDEDKAMYTIVGKAVSPGIAIGRIVYFSQRKLTVERRSVADADIEVERFKLAVSQAGKELVDLAQRTEKELGKENAMLFEVHQMMLEDADYQDAVISIIRTEQVCAEYAVDQTAKQFSELFSHMDDDYMKARAADVQDVSNRVLRILSGDEISPSAPNTPSIYAAMDFSPSETAGFEPGKVLAMVCEAGSENSHTAIFARTMGIPAVIGLDNGLKDMNGHTVIVDGATGKIIVDPDEETLILYREQIALQKRQKHKLEALKGMPAVTVDGQRVDLFANIGSVEDAKLALQMDAEGIGLFRSEFLYLQTSDYPTEQMQFEAYQSVVKLMGQRKVVIRTLDIGADKQINYFGIEKEENPALGYRAIRICLDRPQVFKAQLRALLRASAHGKLAIMLPMITSMQEVQQAKRIFTEAKEELDGEGIPYDKSIELGIMIETPAAVMISDQLAKEVDFFSIGTNDLTQYTLAIDRQNDRLAKFYDPHHIGLLRMIKHAADCIHREGKWIGICGELAGDPAMTDLFLVMKIDELSVSPGRVLELKERIRETNLTNRRSQLLKDLDW